MMIVIRSLVSALFLLVAVPATAQEFPELSGRVVDSAELLTSEQEAELTALSEGIEKASSRQFVIATVPDLQGYPIEDYGYRLGREWKIGQGEANNGVILLVAPNERRVRIEVGYGLEPVIPDGYASGVVNGTILPAFRDGDMGGGIVAGANEIAEQLRLPLEAAEARALEAAKASRGSRGGGEVNWIALIFWIAVILFILVPIVVGAAGGKKYRRGRAPVVIWGPTWGGSSGGGWGGGGFGGGGGGGFGGGFGGGGGSFGGGGASGGW